MSLLFCITVLLVTLKDVNGLHHKSHSKQNGPSNSEKVRVSVFYECLCPDSINFIKDQLWPTFEKLGSIMAVDLVPYGKASVSRCIKKPHHRWEFTCQHGPAECKGNMIQACAIHLVPKTSDILPFVLCVMSSEYPPAAGLYCAEKIGLNWGRISKCANGAEGDNVLHEMGEKTDLLSPRLTFVPWILINGKTSDRILTEAITNLTRLVCRSYQGPNAPETCH